MSYRKKIQELLVPEETLIAAEQIFLHYTVNNLRDQGKSIDLLQMAENKETLAVARALHLAGTIFLKIMPEGVETMEELDKFVEQMDRYKSTLSACMNATRGKIAKMR